MNLEQYNLDDFLLAALDEDIGTGDVTTSSCVSEDSVASAVFIAKDSGVICGVDIAARVFELLNKDVKMTALVRDGDFVNPSAVIAEISGSAQAILMGERTALNILQYLSGIATATSKAVNEIAGANAKITDTRKILPGFRALAKYAVRCGGGSNHRFNLSDRALIKDNHIKAAGGIANAVKLVRLHCPPTLKIEVETESLEQVREAISAGADIIMLDNMPIDMMRDAVGIIGDIALTEASGNIDKRGLKSVAETGVDFISIGALTHSVKALDISLRFS